MIWAIAAGIAFLACVAQEALCAEAAARLQLEVKIPLGNVSGRVDHMALDLRRDRLFVAESGNGTVAGVDLDQRRVQRRLAGFSEPQSVGWSPDDCPEFREVATCGWTSCPTSWDSWSIGSCRCLSWICT